MKKGIHSKVFAWMGMLGFTMFLGDIIPVVVINKIVPSMRDLTIAPTILYHFIAAILFSYIITKFIEQPLLKWGKRVEKNV
jgi:peptidoglycan/LPS O-acetylase OafA/YrhL